MSETDYTKMWSEFWKSGSALAMAQPAMFKEMVDRMAAGGASQAAASASTPFLPAGMSFPWLPFPASDAGVSQNASESFQAAMNAWKELPARLGFAAPSRSDDSKEADRSAAGSDKITAELLNKIMDPREWLSVAGFMDTTVQRLVDGPKFADFGHLESKFAALLKAWNDVNAANLAHQANVLQAWGKAIGEFIKSLNDSAMQASPLSSRSELVGLWVGIANKHLVEAQSSEPFLATQRQLLRASLDLRLAQQAIANVYADLFGLPTRVEMDDLARMVTELRREMREYCRERRAKTPS
jgi:hypothetical protein